METCEKCGRVFKRDKYPGGNFSTPAVIIADKLTSTNYKNIKEFKLCDACMGELKRWLNTPEVGK